MELEKVTVVWQMGKDVGASLSFEELNSTASVLFLFS